MYGFFYRAQIEFISPPPRLLAHYSALLFVVRLQFSAFILYLPPLRLESLGVPCILILSYARTTIRTQWWFRLSCPKRREPPPMLHSSSLLPRLSYGYMQQSTRHHVHVHTAVWGKGKAKKVFFPPSLPPLYRERGLQHGVFLLFLLPPSLQLSDNEPCCVFVRPWDA